MINQENDPHRKILAIKQAYNNADECNLEQEIDAFIYQFHGFTYAEIALIESQLGH